MILIPKGYDYTRMTDLLVDKEINVAAIHVVPDSYMVHPHAKLFKEQFESIRDRLENNPNTSIKGDYFHEAEPEALTEYIVQNCDSAVENSERIKAVLNELSNGQPLQLAAKKHGVQLQSKIVKMIEEAGLKPEQFQKQSAQICDVGWLAEYNPVTNERQSEPMLLIRREELQRLSSTLNSLTKAQASKKKVRDLWKEVLEQELGEGDEVDDKKPIDVYISQHLGLPVKNKILKMSPRDIGRLNPRELADMRKTLIVDRNKLTDIMMNQPDRWFTVDSVAYIWLKADELP